MLTRLEDEKRGLRDEIARRDVSSSTLRHEAAQALQMLEADMEKKLSAALASKSQAMEEAKR